MPARKPSLAAHDATNTNKARKGWNGSMRDRMADMQQDALRAADAYTKDLHSKVPTTVGGGSGGGGGGGSGPNRDRPQRGRTRGGGGRGRAPSSSSSRRGGGTPPGGGGGGGLADTKGSGISLADPSDNPQQLREMLRMRVESGKVASRLEGDHGYDAHPEKTFKALEDIELLSTGRSVRMSNHHALRLSAQLLESTARLRKLRDTVARRAVDKEAELAGVQGRIQDAEKNLQNTFMGVRGEDKLNRSMSRTRKKLSKTETRCDEAEFMTRKLDRMKWHLNNGLMRLHKSNGALEGELKNIAKSEGHARRKRLELYQSLARERRNLDKIADKVKRIQMVQRTKLEEVAAVSEEQSTKFKHEQAKRDRRKRRMTAQLAQAKKKQLSRNVAATFKLNTKKNAIDIQLAPLEDVFYKVRVRTGMVNLSTDQIVDLYLGQAESVERLRKDCGNAMERIDQLKDKLEERRDTMTRLQAAQKETSQHKSFYAELDAIEKEHHGITHKVDLASAMAKRARLNVTNMQNFVRKISSDLRSLNMAPTNRGEAPIDMRTIESSLKEKNLKVPLLELHRILVLLRKTIANEAAEGDGSGGGTRSSGGLSGAGDGNGTASKTRRGVLAPATADDEAGSFSPGSTAGSVRSEFSLALPTTTAGNIRVATRRANEANGYDSDTEFSRPAGGGRGGASEAWKTPRDGVSLQGVEAEGGGGRGGGRISGLPPSGIRRRGGGSKAPSEASSKDSRKRGARVPRTRDQIGDMATFTDKMSHKLAMHGAEDEEDRATATVRSQMKQVTSMVMHRARKMQGKKGGKVQAPLMPRSTRRRSIVIDEDEDDFMGLAASFAASELRKTPKKPKRGKGRRSSNVRRRKTKKRKSTLAASKINTMEKLSASIG